MLCRASTALTGQAGVAAPMAVGRRAVSARNAWSKLRHTAARASEYPPPGSGGSDGGGSTRLLGSAAAEVEIQYRGRTLKAVRGSTLRTALLEGGVTPHNGQATLINCRGLGTCGTCAVEVVGPVEPAEWTPQEQLRLNFPPHGPPGNKRLRLACQVACQGDLQVIKRSKFWGQGEEVVPDLGSGTEATGQPGTDGAAGPAAAAGAAAAEQQQVMPLGQLEFVLDRRRGRVQRQED